MEPNSPLETTETALLKLLHHLRAKSYHFICPTNTTYRHHLSQREGYIATTLRDIFGWSLPFTQQAFPEVYTLLDQAGHLEKRDGYAKSTIRVSSLCDHLFIHSAFPTDQENSVFFGPDTYRFANFIKQHMPRITTNASIVDIGAGSGAGGLLAASLQPARTVILSDLNAQALHFSRINAAFAGIAAECVEASGTAGITMPVSLAVSNPPFMASTSNRMYRDGGDLYGGRLSADWVAGLLPLLEPGGTILLYTGAAIIEGKSPLYEEIASTVRAAGAMLDYHEIDPDIFSNELSQPAYKGVDRIAAVGYVIRKPRL